MKVGVLALITDQAPVTVTDLAMELERRGLESMFIGEHSHLPVASVHPILTELPESYRRNPSQLALLTAAATVTKSLRLGTGICIAPLHSPLQLAKDMATLDWLSGGRVVMGVGYGWNKLELADHGVGFGDRHEVLRETMLAARRLWTQDVASFDGMHVSFGESWAWPKPVQESGPPVLLGAPAGPRTFRYIAEFCDGWMPTSLYPDDLAEPIRRLHEAAEQIGRDPAELRHTMIMAQPALTDLSGDAFRHLLPSQIDLKRYATLGFERLVIGLPLFSGQSYHRGLNLISRFAQSLESA